MATSIALANSLGENKAHRRSVGVLTDNDPIHSQVLKQLSLPETFAVEFARLQSSRIIPGTQVVMTLPKSPKILHSELRRLLLLRFGSFCYHPAPQGVADSAEPHSAASTWMSARTSGSDNVSNPSTYSLRILFVDDEPGLRLVIKNELQKQGHEVTVAEDGVAAIALLDDHNYDCAIIDLKMPNVDGWGVIDHLKKVAPDTDFIISTGHGLSLIHI